MAHPAMMHAGAAPMMMAHPAHIGHQLMYPGVPGAAIPQQRPGAAPTSVNPATAAQTKPGAEPS